MTLLKRIAAEKRALLVPLSVALFINVGVYAIVVYPLEVRSAGAIDRAIAAAAALKEAERDQATARALVTGKARAEQELLTFYDTVVPADLVAARRMTYARLPALARKANVRYEAGTSDVDRNLKSTRLGRLHIRMILQCEYANFRRFIYELETSPEFVIIDDVTLAQSDQNKPVTATLELSTYYRAATNGK